MVAWDSVTEDKAAACFAKGFFNGLGRGCQADAPETPIADCYAQAVQAFNEGGFRWGDPRDRSLMGTTDRRKVPHGCHALLKPPPSVHDDEDGHATVLASKLQQTRQRTAAERFRRLGRTTLAAVRLRGLVRRDQHAWADTHET